MIFATLEGQGRDGTLLVVSADRRRGLAAGADCPTLQYLLDHWDAHAPRLQQLALELDAGRAPGAFSIEVDALLAPLPRAYAFLDGSAYPHHMSVIRQVRGAQMPDNFLEKPLMYQGCSDPFLAPTAPIVLREDISYGIDIEAEVVVITGDVPQGISAEEAPGYVRLLGLLNDVSLRGLIPDEIGRGFGFLQGKSPSALGPFVVTPDEVGALWDGKLLSGQYQCDIRGVRIGDLEPGEDAVFDYADLIAHAAKTRELPAGTVIGAGALANADRDRGCGCIAELRAREHLATGAPKTDYLHFGDSLRLEMFDREGRSIFGAIQQVVERWPGRPRSRANRTPIRTDDTLTAATAAP
jgi:fumarylacetoacetate (FAA) hydrolase